MAEIINRRSRIHVKLLFLLPLFFFFFIIAHGADQRQTEAAEQSSRMSIIDAAKTLFSLRTTISPFTWFHKLKSLFLQPPNLDFRGGGGGGDEGSGGAAEKVKEAAVKSLGKSKSAVEDSAKSAAKLAEEAVGKTVKKLSGKGEQQHTYHDEPEL